jgi:hypothetical protein
LKPVCVVTTFSVVTIVQLVYNVIQTRCAILFGANSSVFLVSIFSDYNGDGLTGTIPPEIGEMTALIKL